MKDGHVIILAEIDRLILGIDFLDEMGTENETVLREKSMNKNIVPLNSLKSTIGFLFFNRTWNR